ncbi:MAG: diguanylate cyclase [Candidatus Omnitrophica bacterium]|nr:diguanylate cyclase [Candidatus Omnitrophota bacterium]
MRSEVTDFLKIESARERLEIELERSRRYRTPVSCLLVEIANFEAVKAQHGPTAALALAGAMKQCLRSETRAVDMPAWYGSGGFFVILPVTGRSGAAVASNRILKKAASLSISAGDYSLRPEIKIGLAVFPDPRVRDGATLIERAEEDLRAPCIGY